MTDLPLVFTWGGEAMWPLRPKAADAQYVVGERYLLSIHEDRSMRSHRHYFASVRQAFASLPEKYADHFATPEHLRHWALIKAGYRDEQVIVTASPEEARKFAAFFKKRRDYSIVVLDGATVTIYTAKSQSMKAMGKKDFRESKDAVLDILAKLIHVDHADLAKSGERTAA